MPERGWLGGAPRPAAHFLLSGSLARSISDDWARTYIQNLGEIALVFRADELGPSGGQELGAQVVLKPVAAEGIAVVDFDEQRAAVAGHAEIGGVAGRRADAVLAASVFHFGTYSIRQVKEYMASQGIPVRLDF